MRRYVIFTIIACIVIASTTHALDQITIELGGTLLVLPVSAQNKAVILRLLTKENARRAAQSTPLAALTLEQFARDLVVDMFRGYKVQTAGEDHVDACAAFKALTVAQQATIMSSMGGFSPCP